MPISKRNTSAAHVNVLLINPVSAFGGAERGLLDIATVLRDTRYRPLVALPGEGPLTERLAEHGIPTRFAPMERIVKTRSLPRLVGHAAGILTCAIRLARLIRRENIALVHANSDTAHLYGGLAATFARVPALWHGRDMVRLGVLQPWLEATATHMIAVSRAAADHWIQNRPGRSPQSQQRLSEKITVLRNAVDTDTFQPRGARDAVRRALGLDPNAFVTGMVAHLSPWKGHALFLEAAQRIAQALPDAAFLVVGDDLFGNQAAYRQRLHTLCSELGIADKVRFAGFQTDMPGLYEAMDVLTHPARGEPFGRVVAEAMAMGTPVVAVNEGGPAEIVEDGVSGLLTEPNPDTIARQVLRLAGEPDLRQRLICAAAQRIRQHFSLDEYRSELLAIYDSL